MNFFIYVRKVGVYDLGWGGGGGRLSARVWGNYFKYIKRGEIKKRGET